MHFAFHTQSASALREQAHGPFATPFNSIGGPRGTHRQTAPLHLRFWAQLLPREARAAIAIWAQRLVDQLAGQTLHDASALGQNRLKREISLTQSETSRPHARAGTRSTKTAPVFPDVALKRKQTLRVFHTAEAKVNASLAGRMVISGRMADVCAELDRLAAQEICDDLKQMH